MQVIVETVYKHAKVKRMAKNSKLSLKPEINKGKETKKRKAKRHIQKKLKRL